jgi:mediator of RNA polymerase II transcription subunit 13
VLKPETLVPGTLGADVTHDAVRYLYEPAFILAEAGTPDVGVGLAPARTAGRDATRVQGDEASASTHGGASGVAGGGGGGGGPDMGSNTTPGGEALDGDSSGSRGQQAPALHCCYAWTEDGHWMVSVWTDARGELLDTHVLPLACVDTQREGAGGLYGLFNQVLQQGLQLLTMAVDAGSRKPRGITITRLGGFFEKECQEWNRVIMSIGGDEVCKWPLQIRHSQQDSSTGGLGGMACSSEVGMLSDSALGLAGSGPASPNPSSSFGVRGKTTTANYGKGSGSDLRRQGGQVINQVVAPPEPPKGAFQWVQSISLVSLCVDQSLQIVTTPDGLSISGAPPGGVSPLSWPVGTSSSGAQSIGITTVRTLASVGAAYLVVPAHESRLLAPGAVLQQLPPGGSSACHEHPPSLAHCLHSSGPACPVASAFVVLGATQAAMTEYLQRGIKEDWPSTIQIGLIAHYGGGSPRVGGTCPQQDVVGPPSSGRLDMVSGNSKPLKSPMGDGSKLDQSLEVHKTLQVVASEMHALSWLTTALTHVHHHHSPLPFHCEVVQRFQRLLGFLDTELGPPMSSKSLLQV